MLALGLLETRGLLPAIEAADVMLKAAQVELIGRTLTGGGLVTITVTGDVGAVKAAVEAAVAAVEKREPLLLVSHHVIPRPHQELESILVRPGIVPREAALVEEIVWAPVDDAIGSGDRLVDSETNQESEPVPKHALQNFCKAEADALNREFGLNELMDALHLLSVVKLRNLAREYRELGIAGRAISKANKDLLLDQLKEYYERRGEP
jgi:microcompartment protein CcmL/EutN